MLKRAFRSARAFVADAELDLQIATKWHRDRKSLPLTPSDRDLYNIIHRFFWRRFSRFPNLIDCDDFNDRIQWTKLFDQSFETVRCTDKILVREHVRERLGPGYCPEIFQIHDRFEDIDFDALPDQFVIKTNHDFASVLVVKDKDLIDKAAAREKFNSALARTYGWDRGEWAYRFVKPKIFVEEFLDAGDLRSPPDYKFACADGSVRFLHYLYDRDQGLKEQLIDLDGNDIGVRFLPLLPYGDGFEMPDNWREMISCASALSVGWKFVRIDLYSVKGKIYVGELTYFPAGGTYPGDGQRHFGKLLDFDRTTFRPTVIPSLLADRPHSPR